MSDVVRITSHPDNEDAVWIHAGPTLAGFMGQISYARWSPDDGAYLLHVDALEGLCRYAERERVAVVDQRQPVDGPHPVAQECRWCGEPGSWEHPPAYCPACGRAWDPVPPPPEDVRERRDFRRCEACGHHQTGRHPYCTRCGHRLPKHRPGEAQADEPLPLAEAVEAEADRLDRLDRLDRGEASTP